MLKVIRKYKTEKKLKSISNPSTSQLNFSFIKTVGVLYHIKNQHDWNELIELKNARFFKDKNVFILALFEIPKVKVIPEVDGVAIITKKDFDKSDYPSADLITDFINTEFDLCIDLSVSFDLRLHAISKLSKAKFKTGLYHKKKTELVFYIKLEETTPVILFDEIIQYLQKLF